RTHCNRSNVDVAIAHSDQAEVLFRNSFTGRGKLGNGTQRSGLRTLSARVRIYFGVKQQNFHVMATGQHVVKTSVSDVVAPAITTHNPTALSYERVRQ